MCRYFNRKVDPEIQAIYQKMLGSIAVAELQVVFEEYIMKPDISKREPPGVNVLYAMWKERKQKQTGKRTARDRKTGQGDVLDERDELRSRMYPLIAKRLLEGQTMIPIGADPAPEWMETIADYVAQQFHELYPGMKAHQISDAKRGELFAMGLKLFDEEREAYVE